MAQPSYDPLLELEYDSLSESQYDAMVEFLASTPPTPSESAINSFLVLSASKTAIATGFD